VTTHDDLRELAAAYVLDTATREERAVFAEHLENCAECRADVAALRPVVQGLAWAAPEQTPPAALRARVLDVARESRPRVVPQETAVRAPFAFRWQTAAALAALLLVAIGVYAINLQNRLRALEAELRTLAEASGRVENEAEALRRRAMEQEAALLVLGATDLARIDLRSEATGSNTRARAFWNRARGLVFTASDLPAVPEGKSYQLWVLTSGEPVSAGLISPDERGVVDLVIQTPADLPTPTGMAVTVEPAGGVPAPTGERLLLGLVAD
jgi:anti-sigma-K factor RskA